MEEQLKHNSTATSTLSNHFTLPPPFPLQTHHQTPLHWSHCSLIVIAISQWNCSSPNLNIRHRKWVICKIRKMQGNKTKFFFSFIYKKIGAFFICYFCVCGNHRGELCFGWCRFITIIFWGFEVNYLRMPRRVIVKDWSEDMDSAKSWLQKFQNILSLLCNCKIEANPTCLSCLVSQLCYQNITISLMRLCLEWQCRDFTVIGSNEVR